ncbi:alkaline phosphatase D family protein [Sphingomonas sp. RIT328]|uniref:alkaline phosphatase D family protein n=1 Tax=Sphingomonas sp. RIT328 TaxID=1470591 RepID=UPI000450BEDB|nr:alkaline phosphatase D family protein [Sphingomonas sp. RIT328]EZP57488.1 Alkaline phosphatase [Sphingomonas sp. RIT328]
MILDRRLLIKTAMIGLGATALPGGAFAVQAMGAARGFTHAVASGEPAADSMLLWTRYVPADGGAVELRVEVAETPDFARVVAGGAQITGPWRDHTAKITVDGLQPGRRYHYRFVAPDGSRSPVGRTATLPEDGMTPWRAAIFSCSNIGFGWFNAYAHAVAQGDFDCAIHLGDYFYEYAPAHYPLPADAVPGRTPAPLAETIHLADYRLRYGSYRADPDLQALHAAMPMIVQWDDHESANDSWEGGAENHDPATEGDWNARRAASIQAYREWMPVSDEPWRAYDIGGLATLFRTETRLLARTRQPDIAPLFRAADPATALKAFRDGAWQDPAATMMGSQQEVWLAHAMRASVRSGRPWQIVGFGTIMGATVMPAETERWLADMTPAAQGYVHAGVVAGQLGLPFNYDNWGGYPAARARFLRSVQQLGGNTVVISGDSHNAWAYDLAQDGRPAAVEFAGHSVTSPGFESSLKTDPARVAAALVRVNPELKWCDTSRRGYMAMTVAADRVTNDWIMVDGIKTRTPRAAPGHRATVLRDRHVMA